MPVIDNPTVEQNPLWQYTLESVARGAPLDALEQDLVSRGAPPATAKALVLEAERLKLNAIRRAGLANIMLGLVLTILGAAISYVGLLFSAWIGTPMLFVSVSGLVLAGRGLFQLVTGMHETPLFPVVLLPEAITAIRREVESNELDSRFWVRVEVHLPAGPETLHHTLDIARDPPRPQDREFESGGLPMVVLADQVEMLKGCTVDHGVRDGKAGFIFKNPQFEGNNAWMWLRDLEWRRRG